MELFFFTIANIVGLLIKAPWIIIVPLAWWIVIWADETKNRRRRKRKRLTY